MDYWHRFKTKVSSIYIHKMGTRRTSDTGNNSGASGADFESRPGHTLAEPAVNHELLEIKGSVQGLDSRVLANILALLAEAQAIHAKDPMTGHKLADQVLLQAVNNAEVSAAFKKCC